MMVTPTEMLYSAHANFDILHRATTGPLLGQVVSPPDMALLCRHIQSRATTASSRGNSTRHTLVC